MDYQKLEIWKLAKELTISIHNCSLKLPKFEQFEEAQQIRRSIKSVRSNIVEGFGRRYYKQEFIKFIVYAIGSNYETIDHLDMLFECGSLVDKEMYDQIREKLDLLAGKLNKFLTAVEHDHTRPS